MIPVTPAATNCVPISIEQRPTTSKPALHGRLAIHVQYRIRAFGNSPAIRSSKKPRSAFMVVAS